VKRETTVPTLSERLSRESDPVRRTVLIDEALRPPEPQLLDTCVLQNLDWVDRQLEAAGSVMWDDAAVAALRRRYGIELATDLIDLGILYKEFESRSGYPWLLCMTTEEEAAPTSGRKGERLREALRFFRGHQEDWTTDAYPGVAQGLLLPSRPIRVSPLLLRGLGGSPLEKVFSKDGPLSFLEDDGDRAIAAHALIANIPVVLTTDRATFWKHRDFLADMWLKVMRPSELLKLYFPYWEALDEEFRQRRVAKS
jgi:hypothetical protein